MGKTVFLHDFHIINYIDFDHATFRSESRVALCPVNANRSPNRLFVVFIKAYSLLPSLDCIHVHDGSFHDFQLSLINKSLKSVPAETDEVRVCFERNNTEALTQVK